MIVDKRIRFLIPHNIESILVVGSSEASIFLFDHLQSNYPDKDIVLDDEITGSADLIIIVDKPESVFRPDGCKAVIKASHSECHGLTVSQKILQSMDWIAIRDFDRAILSICKAGNVELPADILSRIMTREFLRESVDYELGTTAADGQPLAEGQPGSD